MDDINRPHRAARVFLARLVMIHGADAGDFLRRMAVPEADKRSVLADLEVIYRRQRAVPGRQGKRRAAGATRS